MNKEAFNELVMQAAAGRPVKIHSELVEPGDIFVALSGSKLDGGSFISRAFEKGASAVVASNDHAQASSEKKVVGHDSPAQALGELARAFFHTGSMKLKVVGITGTNGKTTTSYLLEHIFTANGIKTGVMGTVSHRWPGNVIDASMTTPDCLQIHEILSKMEGEGVEIAVMEVSSHALAQDRTAGVKFSTGIFTNLTQDHLDYHGDMESYFEAKAKLFLSHGPEDSFEAVINADDQYGQRLLSRLPRATGYGLEDSGSAHFRGWIENLSGKGIRLRCDYYGQRWSIDSPLCGKYNAYNLMAAQAGALSMGLKPSDMKCLENTDQVPGRLEKITSHGRDIFIDYAHTPDALENVCSSVGSMGYSRMMVVFGCGGNRDRAKRPLMANAVSGKADIVFLTSDNPRWEDPLEIIKDTLPGLKGCRQYHVQPDRRQAIAEAVGIMKPGDALIVAGKGHENYQEVRGEKQPFSDAAEVRRVLSALQEL